MSQYQENFQVEDKLFANNIFYAPLAGYTNVPFRKMCLQGVRPGLLFCEMVKMEALIRANAGTYKILEYENKMHPIGAQICGSNPKIAKEIAKILEDLGFDWIDFNCGCPVPKVTKDGSGSAMLKNPSLIGDILNELVNAVKIPVSVKIRTGWDSQNINALEVLEIAQRAKASAVFIHGRTQTQGYRGNADWQIIKQCKEKAKTIKVFGNGDLFNPEAVKRMFEETNCDGVLLARGMIGYPSFVKHIKNYYEQIPFEETVLDIKEHLLTHFSLIKKMYPEIKAILEMRKIGCWYLKRIEAVKPLKVGLNQAKTVQEAVDLIENFSWEKVKIK